MILIGETIELEIKYDYQTVKNVKTVQLYVKLFCSHGDNRKRVYGELPHQLPEDFKLTVLWTDRDLEVGVRAAGEHPSSIDTRYPDHHKLQYPEPESENLIRFCPILNLHLKMEIVSIC